MRKNISIKTDCFLIILLMAVAFAFSLFQSHAFSVPAAGGQVNSYEGAILRKSASVNSQILTVLSDNTSITIHKEVFKSKTGTSSVKRWWYVTAGNMKGYIRADLVDDIRYESVSGTVTKKCAARKGAGTSMAKAKTLKKGTKVKVVLTAKPVRSVRGSSSKWYKVISGKKYYYICSSNIKLRGASAPASAGASSKHAAPSASDMSSSQFETYLKKQGFPESYKPMLKKLHKAHPNWTFKAYNTGIKWSDALAKQTKGGTSLVSGVFGRKYRDGNRQYESGWYKANSKVVAYYMDPRNFLNENSVYMFEDLSYKPAYQTSSVVKVILSPTKLPSNGFTASVFVNAGKANNVSPVFLAARARQECGGGSIAISGKKVLGTKVYNPFNIGAFGGTNPVYNGLLYAYAKGWKTPAKATTGGAKELAKNYINKGQFTGYYQRFNVRNGSSKAGTHQYMTNIMAPYTEASSAKTFYKKYGILDQSLVFEIPIYKSMPSSTKLP